MDTCCLCTRPQGSFSDFAIDKAARFLFPVKRDLQDLQIQGKMRLTQLKESQTKKKWYKKARKVSFVRSIIDDE